MHTLFRSITGGVDWAVYAKALAEVNWLWTYLFTAFIAFSVFAVLNVMTGHHNGGWKGLCGAWSKLLFTGPLIQNLFYIYYFLEMVVEHTVLGTVSKSNQTILYCFPYF